MNQAKTFLLGFWGTGSSFGSVAVANHVTGWLQVVAVVVGILSGLVAIYWMNKLNGAKVREINNSLCEACREGHLPNECPIPPRQRPKDCPVPVPARGWFTNFIRLFGVE